MTTPARLAAARRRRRARWRSPVSACSAGRRTGPSAPGTDPDADRRAVADGLGQRRSRPPPSSTTRHCRAGSSSSTAACRPTARLQPAATIRTVALLACRRSAACHRVPARRAGRPARSAGDISRDGTQVVFQDWAARPRLYEADLDGRGSASCSRSTARQLSAARSPTTTRRHQGRATCGSTRCRRAGWTILDPGDRRDRRRLESDRRTRRRRAGRAAVVVAGRRQRSPSAITWDRADARRDDHYGDGTPALACHRRRGRHRAPRAARARRNAWRRCRLVAGRPRIVSCSTADPASTAGSVADCPPVYMLDRIGTDGVRPDPAPTAGARPSCTAGRLAHPVPGRPRPVHLMEPDGTGTRPVDPNGIDLADLRTASATTAHWLPPAPDRRTTARLDWPPRTRGGQSLHVLRRPRQHPAPAPHPAPRARRLALRRGAVRRRGVHRPQLAAVPPRPRRPGPTDRAGQRASVSRPPTTTSTAID